MSDLLIAGAFDLSGIGWTLEGGDRFVPSLLLGNAGDVRWGQTSDGACLAARALHASGPGAPRIRKVHWQAGPDGAFTILAGRLFDEVELATRLGLDPALSGAALYAAVRRAAGEDCDRLIDGNYSVLEWFPCERRLRLARAPFGHYPLHIWRRGNRIAVASIPRALFALGASSEVDDDYLADILVFNFQNQERGWYRDLAPTPCATITDIDLAGIRRRKFWSVETVPPVRLARDTDYVDAVDDLMQRSVRANLADVKNPALFLSGGLDSQATAVYMLDQLPGERPLTCLTSVPLPGGFPDLDPGYFFDERGHVAALREMYPRLEPHFIDCPDTPYDGDLDRMMLLGSWPIHNQFAAHWGHAGLRRAHASGCDVVFSAVGGNACFSHDGRPGYPTWLRTLHWGRLAREIAHLDDERPFLRRLFHYAVRPNLPPSLNDFINRLRGHDRSAGENFSPLNPEFLRGSGARERAREMGVRLDSRPYASSSALHADTLSTMQAETGELRTACALLHGVEEREMMTYRPLLDFCLGVPDDQYLRNGEPRWLARRLLKGKVPEQVRTERRSGLQSGDWAVRLERDRPRILAELDSMALDPRLTRLFDIQGLRADLAAWKGPSAPQMEVIARLQWGLGRCLSHARFVRFAEGRNAG